MLLWNAVDGFTEIEEDPFLIKDNEITYQGDQSEIITNIIPGKDGFIPFQGVWGGDCKQWK